MALEVRSLGDAKLSPDSPLNSSTEKQLRVLINGVGFIGNGMAGRDASNEFAGNKSRRSARIISGKALYCSVDELLEKLWNKKIPKVFSPRMRPRRHETG